MDEEHTIVEQDGLTHSLFVFEKKLYATTADALYRWSYSDGQTYESTDRETVIANLNTDGKGGTTGGHSTRSIGNNHLSYK